MFPSNLTCISCSHILRQVTTVALSATVAHLAIGLGDGTVILYRHLDQSLASSTSLTSLPKARTVHESPTEPITGLGFREPTGDLSGYLYVVTTNRVLSYLASGSGASATMVDEIGTGLGCTTMDSKAKDIIVVRDEAIYLCGIDGRGPCYAFEGTILSYLTCYLTHRRSILKVISPLSVLIRTTSSSFHLPSSLRRLQLLLLSAI